mmetsp:Transcript_27063/g.79993  ORF Transcript_27063/g.79993 Transcript_27063/m.79993 type:complete len:289 (-) Transcript_27063:108-974(-)|eukprot:CAMPEP_0113531474 /NCGR_PEP_ID=MMETSP0015_2-20120614/3516_1 /TAXON_ID=2838 /ORGANISM="Odontella" /LENGTH=288 /DNA_ID=CAMNT_0000430313 /DNA_START=232 /DNA_END=1098 /DNA_ORIENTATION=+ /assembly_acc=CAM_ASM_000160
MSLRGRYFIDRIKRAVSHRFILPCPPYGKPSYWDGVYSKFGPHDSFEWAGVNLKDNLLQHRYDRQHYSGYLDEYGYSTQGSNEPVETTFGEAIGVHPGEKGKVMLLGCGNSRLGEEMVDHGWVGPVVQVDVSPKLISSMTERCASYMQKGCMNVIQDDANWLTAFEDSSIDAVVDKGLVDAFFCSDQPLGKVMISMSRVLKPGGVFAFLSYSRPEFLLSQVMEDEHGKVKGTRLWKDVQIRALDSILMYRFVKGKDQPKRERNEANSINLKRLRRSPGRSGGGRKRKK